MAELLLLAIFLPLLGAVLVWLLAPVGAAVVRMVALGITLVTLLVVAILVGNFPSAGGVWESSITEWNWLAQSTSETLSVRFSVGLDGLSLWLFALSALLMVTAVLVSWRAIQQRTALFYGMLLLLECGCLGVFAARDIILFYLFFEFTLVPLFFLIGIWGYEQRRYAASKFFLYTFAGSVLTFLALLTIVLWVFNHPPGAETAEQGVMQFSIPELTAALQAEPMPLTLQMLVFFGLLAGFAIKVPLFPLHTWLPLAHVQAPTAGSVFLAGLLLKIGTYGFVRFNIPMLPQAAAAFMPFILWMSVIGIIYGALVALVQSDMKRLIAYSSVSHLGFCMLGLFALNPVGISGGTLQMVNHGLSTGALFALVGMVYERYHTREISELGGLSRRMPWMAFFMLLFTFSSIGLPGLNGFVGEFMVLLAMFQRAWADAPAVMALQWKIITVLAVTGVLLGAWYMLWLVQRVFFGPLKEHHDHGEPARHGLHDVQDMSWREVCALAPLAVFVVWIGIYPQFFLRRMDATLVPISEIAQQAIDDRYEADEPVANLMPETSTRVR